MSTRVITRTSIDNPPWATTPTRKIVRSFAATKTCRTIGRTISQSNVPKHDNRESLRSDVAKLAAVIALRLRCDKAEKALKERINTKLVEAGLAACEIERVLEDGKAHTINANLVTKSFTKVNVAEYKKHVTAEQFMASVSVSVKDATDQISGAMLNKCVKVDTGAPYVEVSCKPPVSDEAFSDEVNALLKI